MASDVQCNELVRVEQARSLPLKTDSFSCRAALNLEKRNRGRTGLSCMIYQRNQKATSIRVVAQTMLTPFTAGCVLAYSSPDRRMHGKCRKSMVRLLESS